MEIEATITPPRENKYRTWLPQKRPISWDYDDGRIDFANSPHTRDTVPGFYLGLGLEHLFTSNFGFEMGVRYYNFGTMDLNWGDSPGGEEESGADQYYKYENTLTQAQFGLVYYFGK